MATVLLVDDSPLVRQSLSMGLTSAGHIVISATNGSEAQKVIAAGNVDIIVTDIIMPDGEGIELITQIRREGLAVPIIAMTGGYSGALTILHDHGPLHLKAARILGATKTLSKPFPASALNLLVDECLQKKASARET